MPAGFDQELLVCRDRLDADAPARAHHTGGAAIGMAGGGAIGGVLLSRIVGSFVPDVQMPGLDDAGGARIMVVSSAH